MDMSEPRYLSEPDAERVRALLRKAKGRLLDPDKWWHGGKGEECAVLAIINAGPPLDAHKACASLSRAIGAQWYDFSHLYAWNDAPGRTHAQVLAAMDRAVELVE
jgi:hypothetical protein